LGREEGEGLEEENGRGGDRREEERR